MASDSVRINLEVDQAGVQSGLSKVGKSLSGLGKAVAGAFTLAGATLAGTALAGIQMGDELTASLNGIEAATGYNEDSMNGMKDAMLNIYNSNFGEDFTDIGESIAEVAKQTSATGKELEDLTKNALMLRDTFDFDVTESVRSAQMMMTQFGISGDDAYNLIAQGAQYGLDKNGDLLDTINEYSGTFKEQGFSAEEMFNMLQNGAASGAFSVDKLGDAMKEFGIRSKDGSKASSEGFEALGLDAADMTRAFAEGGESAKSAFTKTTEALFAIQDPVAQNSAGVALFGTQWEDLGVKGVKALTETQGEISTTTDALGGINAVKYDTFGEAVEGIKRQLTTGLALPIGDAVLPKLNELGDKLQESLPSIIETLKPILDKLISAFEFLADNMNIVIPVIGILAGAFVTLSVISAVTNAVSILTGAFALLKLAKLQDIIDTGILVALYIQDAVVKGASAIAQGALTIATGIWNVVCGIATVVTWAFGAAVAFLTSPIGLVILAIVAIIAIIYLLVKNWDTVKEVAGKVWDFIVSVWSAVAEWFYNTVIAPLVSFFTGLWDSIVAIFSGVASWFSSMFTEAYNAIVSVFSAVGGFFANIWTVIKEQFTNIGSAIGDAIGGAFKFVVNSIIGFAEKTINGFIGAINGAISLINNIPGVEISQLSTLSVPRLAKGAVIKPNTNFLAMLGDQKSGINIETPLSTMVQAFKTALSNSDFGGGSGGQAVIIVQVDGKEVSRSLADLDKHKKVASNGY